MRLSCALVRPTVALLAAIGLLAGCSSEASPSDNVTLVDVSDPSGLPALGVEALPQLTLGCVATWTTAAPTVSAVRVRPVAGGDAEWRVVRGTEGATTTHRVTVVGLYVGDWELQAVDGEAAVTATARFTAGPLPEGLVDGEVKVAAPGGPDAAWVLTQVGFGLPWVPSPTFAVMVDLAGRIRWYAPNGGGPAGLATWLPGDDTVLSVAGGVAQEVAFDGTVTWTSPVEPEGEYTWWDFKDGTWHHDYRKLPNGNLSVLRRRNLDKNGRDVLEEMDPQGKLLWSWDTAPLNATIDDICYGSASVVDHARGKVIYAARTSAVVAQIGLESGEVEWIAGPAGNLTQVGDWQWFTDPHSPVVLSDDGQNLRLLLLDSGTGEQNRTRIVELSIDAKAKTAELVWQYPPAGSDDDIWYAPGGGSGERLPSGNTAIATMEADPDNPLSFARVRLIEVTPEGQRMSHVTIEGSFIIYRAQRVPPLLPSAGTR